MDVEKFNNESARAEATFNLTHLKTYCYIVPTYPHFVHIVWKNSSETMETLNLALLLLQNCVFLVQPVQFQEEQWAFTNNLVLLL